MSALGNPIVFELKWLTQRIATDQVLNILYAAMKADAKGLVLAILGDLSARARNEISNVLQDGADSPDHSRAGRLRRADWSRRLPQPLVTPRVKTFINGEIRVGHLDRVAISRSPPHTWCLPLKHHWSCLMCLCDAPLMGQLDDGVETTLMDLEWTSINVPGRSTQVRTLAWSVVAPGFYRNAAIA